MPIAAESLRFLSTLATSWEPVVPPTAHESDHAVYDSRLSILVRELKDNAAAGNAVSVSALASQVLEFTLKVALEAAGTDRTQLSGTAGTLHSLLERAKAVGLFFDHATISTDSMFDRTQLDRILHRDLVQHSILQAHEYRNQASHGNPWSPPLTHQQASRQLGAVIALCEMLAPTLPNPHGSADSPQLQELRTLHHDKVALALSFLPFRSVKRVNELLARVRAEGDEEHFEALLRAVNSTPAWLFSRSTTTTLPDLRLLLQTLHSLGYSHFSYAAAVLLPVNDLALTYIVRKAGQPFHEHIYMARHADPDLFARLLSRTDKLTNFIDEFANQVTGAGDKGFVTVYKADWLAKAFGNFPARLRNQLLLRLGPSLSCQWLRSLRYGAYPPIVGSISDAAAAQVSELGVIRKALRIELLSLTPAMPPRHIVHGLLAFCHTRSSAFRFELYRAVLQSVRANMTLPEQQAASCRAVLEIAISLGHRGPVSAQCRAIAEQGSKSAENVAVRAGFHAAAKGARPTLEAFAHLKELPEALADLATDEALTTFYVTIVAGNQEWNEKDSSLMRVARATAEQIMVSRSKPTVNPLEAFARKLLN